MSFLKKDRRYGVVFMTNCRYVVSFPVKGRRCGLLPYEKPLLGCPFLCKTTVVMSFPMKDRCHGVLFMTNCRWGVLFL